MTGGNYNKKLTPKQAANARNALLAWYDRNARAMPWRAPPGMRPDPYHEWLSEIMLQQTTVNAVIPYFLKFVKKWPNVKKLAIASQEEVMREWAGLGYYARARNLHACAKMVANELGGVFPETQEELKKLPGIGDYTANAIAAIAFNKPATVVDGNVERVMARYFAVEEPLPKVKPELKRLAGKLTKNYTERPGDLAQAMMELGATVCIPANPRCGLCPLNKTCEGKKLGIAAELPRKFAEKKRPQKYGAVYWVTDSKGRILVHRRPQKGLLGGMAGLPTSNWTETKAKIAHPQIIGEHIGRSRVIRMKVEHTFTHFDLRLDLHRLEVKNLKAEDHFWVEAGKIGETGLPTVFKKAQKIFEKGL
jgi:A/G-specific adenine glycosylase